MLDTPYLADASAQHTAVVRLRVPRAQLPQAIDAAIQEVRNALAAQHVAAAGPWLAHYLRMDPAAMELEVGVPVGRPVAPAGRVTSSALPATRVARAIYQGPYEGLYAAWSEFGSWIGAEGHATSPGLWEVYIVGPESGEDPSAWRTELNLPLAG